MTDTSVALEQGLIPHRPQRHHIDRRAADLTDTAIGNADDLMSTLEVASWLGVSIQFLTIGRHRGYGPRYCKLSPRRIRYLRSDVMTWLRERSFSATHEYPGPTTARGGRPRKAEA